MTDRQSPEDRSPFPPEIGGGGVVLTLTPDQLYVTFAETPPLALDAFLTQYRLRPVPEEHGSGPRSGLEAVVLGQRWLQSATGENTARLITEIRADDRVATATPVYHRADLLPVVSGLSFVDHLLVRFHPRAAEEEIRALIEALGTEDVVSIPDAREGPLHQLRLPDPKRQEVFEIVQGFAQSPMVRYAGPDWIQLHSPLTATPNDPMFAQQWNLTRIGAHAGWDIAQGSDRLIIAILDTGCDLHHPDLVAKYVPVPDRLDLLSNPPFGGHQPQEAEPNGGSHGTCTAGIAAAAWNNKLGVAGVAPNCLIMPIRLFGETTRLVSVGSGGTGPFVTVVRVQRLMESTLVKGIDWARTHGAHVASMSLAWTGPHTNADIALNNAHAAGMVLVAASGNCFPHLGCTLPAPVQYPASHPRVIAVGASDHDDRRHHLASPDGPGWPDPWESRYGPELSVVAPSPVWTTARNGVYSRFTGTSAATPHVAGLAALLLSLLHYGPYAVDVPWWIQMNDLVRSIIERTAAKVGRYSYANDAAHPNGTWHAEMGYGRIDMARALRFARDNYTTYKLERPSRDYAVAVQILLGLTPGGGGVVWPPGGPPVPVDPGWQYLTPQTRDVLLGLAITELAGGVNDPEARRAIERAGREAIERAARQIGHD